MYRVSAGHSLTKLCGQNCDWAQLGILFLKKKQKKNQHVYYHYWYHYQSLLRLLSIFCCGAWILLFFSIEHE